MSGKLITIFPSGTQAVQYWTKSRSPDWETLQGAVGGYIERINVHWEGRFRQAWVNENGLAKGLPPNPHARALIARTRFAGQTIVGQIVIWVPDPRRAMRATEPLRENAK